MPQHLRWATVLLMAAVAPVGVVLHVAASAANPTLAVPILAQRDVPQGSKDPGTYDCLPTSTTMVLSYLQGQELIPDSIDLSYNRIRTRFREIVTNPLTPISDGIALLVTAELTSAVAADDFQTTGADWQAFLRDQLTRGYPVIASIGNWSLLNPNGDVKGETGWHPHAIVVTGISANGVNYNDPWDGAAHHLSLDQFAAAWKSRYPDGGDYAWGGIFFASQARSAGAPPAPTLVEANEQSAGPSETVHLRWSSVGDRAQYKIAAWNHLGRWVTWGWLDETSFESAIERKGGTLENWRVKARNPGGDESPYVVGTVPMGAPVPPVVSAPVAAPVPLPLPDAKTLLAESVSAMRLQANILATADANLLLVKGSGQLSLTMPDGVDGEGSMSGVSWSVHTTGPSRGLFVADHFIGDIGTRGAAVQVRDAVVIAVQEVSDWAVRDNGPTYQLNASLPIEEVDKFARDLGIPVRGRPSAKLSLVMDHESKLWQQLRLDVSWPAVRATVVGREIEVGPGGTAVLHIEV